MQIMAILQVPVITLKTKWKLFLHKSANAKYCYDIEKYLKGSLQCDNNTMINAK
jgi:hypothetical protein